MSTKKRCMIVDDEPAAHYVLINYIGKFPDLELVKQCYNGFDALNYLKEQDIDLMFLDINMPEITGMELLKTLKNPPHTILTTAYSEFALESYEYGVIDYLLKPVYFPRFLTSIERFLNLVQVTPVQEKQTPESVFLEFRMDGDPIRVNFQEILYSESYGNYVKLICKNKTYLAPLTTNSLEKMLPDSLFVRIHRSHIVSLDNINSFTKEYVQIGDVKLSVGITYRHDLFRKMAERS